MNSFFPVKKRSLILIILLIAGIAQTQYCLKSQTEGKEFSNVKETINPDKTTDNTDVYRAARKKTNREKVSMYNFKLEKKHPKCELSKWKGQASFCFGEQRAGRRIGVLRGR